MLATVPHTSFIYSYCSITRFSFIKTSFFHNNSPLTDSHKQGFVIALCSVNWTLLSFSAKPLVRNPFLINGSVSWKYVYSHYTSLFVTKPYFFFLFSCIFAQFPLWNIHRVFLFENISCNLSYLGTILYKIFGQLLICLCFILIYETTIPTPQIKTTIVEEESKKKVITQKIQEVITSMEQSSVAPLYRSIYNTITC